MDLVIPVADEPVNRTLDLALTTVRRHAPNLRVVLVGDAGSYAQHEGVDEGVYFPQRAGRPIQNTDAMMHWACTNPAISDPFVWSNDDIFWRRPTDLSELLAQSRSPNLYPVGRTPMFGKGRYGRHAVETLRTLRAHHLPETSYERHVPLLVEKALMLDALALGGSKRTVYGNLLDVRDQENAATLASAGEGYVIPAVLEGRRDVKLFKLGDPLPPLETEPFLSSGNSYPVDRLRAILGV